MLNRSNTEKQVRKRLRHFLLQQSGQEFMEAADARLVVNVRAGQVSVHLYDQHKFLKTIGIPAIVDFFGKDYDETKVHSLASYLKKISQENNIALLKANMVICETNGELRAHLYDEHKYVKGIPTIELLTAVY